jgi:hypothetical protein
VFGQGPREGSLYQPDAVAIAEVARHWTTTPEDCWFCVWEGWGSLNALSILSPRVRLPGRDYLLYGGPVESVTSTYSFGVRGQSPNLWWPEDHAWCVATEIDLQWTYVGGKKQMIDQLIADERIEAFPAAPDDSPTRIENWVQDSVEVALDQLLTDGNATISTSKGTIEASLERPGLVRDGQFSARSKNDEGQWQSSRSIPLRSRDDDNIRLQISHQLTQRLIALTEL